ncbi:MAG: bifunctional folylpolyglutamate synthase/dihydrofolate synthase [Negativicutes bacterium]|nr:bifunctional folylpolyglutamate synthase/dihydrofolate synthase [Negativicutes bacterium]
MTYEETLDYLASLSRFGINLGLSRIKKLTQLLGHPERRYKTVHITGTNGKGSTTAMTAAVLQAAGIRTGMYISPHLTDYTERITVDGQPVSRKEFAAAVAHVKTHVEQMTAAGAEQPTEFEVITAAALHYFAAAHVEYAVIEVGLGGLLDSTNVVRPEVAVITNVALEHTDRCGNTIEEIAAHKAGIIKPGVPVVTGAAGAALAVIMAEAARQKAPVYRLGHDFQVEPLSAGLTGQSFAWRDDKLLLRPLRLRLLGRHQLDNAALTVKTAVLLAANEPRLSAEAIRWGLEAAFWPGRFELLGEHPVFVVDGAHNPAGALTLRVALDEYFPGQNITFVLGILQDKDMEGIIRALIRQGDRVFTVAPASERAAGADKLAALIPGARAAVSLEEAIRLAADAAGKAGVVCIAGSLYLVGTARAVVRNM